MLQWAGIPFLRGTLPGPGIKTHVSHGLLQHQADSLPLSHPRSLVCLQGPGRPRRQLKQRQCTHPMNAEEGLQVEGGGLEEGPSVWLCFRQLLDSRELAGLAHPEPGFPSCQVESE